MCSAQNLNVEWAMPWLEFRPHMGTSSYMKLPSFVQIWFFFCKSATVRKWLEAVGEEINAFFEVGAHYRFYQFLKNMPKILKG